MAGSLHPASPENVMQEVVGGPSDERARTAFNNLHHTDRFIVAENGEDIIRDAYFRWADDEM